MRFLQLVGDLERAGIQFEQAVKIDSLSREEAFTVLEMVHSAIDRNQLTLATRLLKSLRDGTAPLLLYEQCYVFQALDKTRIQKIPEFLSHRERLAPRCTQTEHADAATKLMQRRDFDGALAELREQIMTNPFYEVTYWQLAEVYRLKGWEEKMPEIAELYMDRAGRFPEICDRTTPTKSPFQGKLNEAIAASCVNREKVH